MPPGSASISRRAATLTPSPKISFSSTITSPRLMPMRNCIHRAGETSALRRAIPRWISAAPSTAAAGSAQGREGEAIALGLRIDVAGIVRDRLLFFFQPLDALDDGLELVFGKFCRGRFLDGGSSGGHRVLLDGTDGEVEGGSAARFPTHRIPT